jgi:hypothetical protein
MPANRTSTLQTTSGAANAVPCPVAYILFCIRRGIIAPIKDSNNRSLLTDEMVERIREHRAERRRLRA